MRGCVLLGLVLLLLGVNGYALWQITQLRTEVADLRAEVSGLRRQEAEPETSLVKAALKAVQQGRWEQARATLERLSARIEQAKAVTGRSREEVQRRLAEARAAVTRKRQEAETALQALLRALPGYEGRGDEDEPARNSH